MYEQQRMIIKGVADVVFVIDRSRSMQPFIENLREVLEDFLNKLQNEDGVDVRLGLVGQANREFIIKHFTKNVNELRGALSILKPLGNEFTLPALDWAADFPWDEAGKAHRIILLLTDEPLSQGFEPDFQRLKMFELAEKINQLKIKLFYFGHHCPEYKDLVENKISKGLYVEVFFKSIKDKKDELLKVIDIIRKTVSNASIGYGQQVSAKINKNLYGLPLKGIYPTFKYI